MDMAGICAKDIMNTEVKTVERETSLVDAARMLRDGRVSSLVVERREEHDAFGIITRKDVVEVLSSLDTEGIPVLVEDVMTKPAITVAPELALVDCIQLMRMVGVRRLPVVDGSGLVGILSNTDVFHHLTSAIA